MTTTCPHCQCQITVHLSASGKMTSRAMLELQTVARNGGWLFGAIARSGEWKNDPDLSGWLEKGWVEFDEKRGFRITPDGRAACQG